MNSIGIGEAEIKVDVVTVVYVDWMFSVGGEELVKTILGIVNGNERPCSKGSKSWFDWYSNLLLCNLATLSNHCGTYV